MRSLSVCGSAYIYIAIYEVKFKEHTAHSIFSLFHLCTCMQFTTDTILYG